MRWSPAPFGVTARLRAEVSRVRTGPLDSPGSGPCGLHAQLSRRCGARGPRARSRERHSTGNSPAVKRRLSTSNSARRDLSVADVRLDAVALAQRAGELAQAPDPLGEHDHLLLAGDPGERLRGDRRAAAAARPRRRASPRRRGPGGPALVASAALECVERLADRRSRRRTRRRCRARRPAHGRARRAPA